MYQIIIVFFFPCVYQVIIVLKVYPNIVQVYGAVPVIVSVTQLMTVFFFFSSEIGV